MIRSILFGTVFFSRFTKGTPLKWSDLVLAKDAAIRRTCRNCEKSKRSYEEYFNFKENIPVKLIWRWETPLSSRSKFHQSSYRKHIKLSDELEWKKSDEIEILQSKKLICTLDTHKFPATSSFTFPFLLFSVWYADLYDIIFFNICYRMFFFLSFLTDKEKNFYAISFADRNHQSCCSWKSRCLRETYFPSRVFSAPSSLKVEGRRRVRRKYGRPDALMWRATSSLSSLFADNYGGERWKKHMNCMYPEWFP